MIGFFQSSLRWVDGFKKFQRYWVIKNLLYNRIEAFFKKFYQKWNNASSGAQFRYFQIKWVKNRSIRLKILTYESPMQSYAKNRVKLWQYSGSWSNLKVRNQYIYCLPRSYNGFPLYFAQCSFTEMKSTFIKLQNEPLPKDIGKKSLIVNNSV